MLERNRCKKILSRWPLSPQAWQQDREGARSLAVPATHRELKRQFILKTCSPPEGQLSPAQYVKHECCLAAAGPGQPHKVASQTRSCTSTLGHGQQPGLCVRTSHSRALARNVGGTENTPKNSDSMLYYNSETRGLFFFFFTVAEDLAKGMVSLIIFLVKGSF